MKCGEPKPGDSWRSCERDLKHPGGHKYLNDTWPRLVPDGLDWDVQELLDTAAPRNAYGLMERSFPIVVTETTTRVIWVDAEDEDEALAYYADDYADVPLKDAEVLAGDLEFERPDKWQRQEAFRANRFESKIGPLVPCPDCGKQAFRREWYHDPYRKCHGPIDWRTVRTGRAYREHHSTPVFDAARQAVAANA